MLELNIMGWPQMRLGAELIAVRPRRLLFFSFLALEGPVDRGKLAACFWEGLDPEVARSRLRLELHRISRSNLGNHLRVSGESVGVELSCDALALTTAHQAQQWSEVARLYRGPLLTNLAVDTPTLQSWLEAGRARYAEWVRLALERVLAEAEAQADPYKAVDAETRLLDLDPYSETACARVLSRLRGLGRVQEAFAVEARFQVRYRNEMGEVPRPESRPRPAGQSSERQPVERPTLQFPPFVGREAACRQLDDWASRGKRVALLTGEGGVGKTRLAEEWAARRGEQGLVLRGNQLARNVPFSTVGDGLHRIGEARLRALPPIWRAELASVWPELVPDQRAKRATNQPRLFEAVSEALLIGLNGAPIVLDDLHWFDPSSVLAVSHALRRWSAKGQPRVLATGRPGELGEHGTALAWLDDLDREGELLRIDLAPLSEVSVLKMIRQLSGSHQATGFARKLHALSGGNAYALLAFLQGLEEEGVLNTAEGAAWSLTVDLDGLDQHLPSSLRDRLCQMVSRVGGGALRWMEVAALLAPPFDFQAVRAGSGLSEGAALTALEQSLAHRWIEPVDSAVYRLRHDLLRHALQGQLQRERARVIHLRLASHLGQLESRPAQVAHHLEEAGERHLAFPGWIEAVGHAEVLWAHGEALDTLAHAIFCTDDHTTRIDLHLRRCNHLKALHDLGGWGAELDRLSALLKIELTSAVNGPQELTYVRERTHLLWRTGDIGQALLFSEPWSRGPTSAERIALHHDRALMMYQCDRSEEAMEVLLAALKALDPDWKRLAANLHNALVLCALDLGQVERGRQHAAWAVRLFSELATKDGLASAHANEALVFGALGDHAAQRRELELALRHAAEGQNVFLERQCLEVLCDVVTEDADWSSALALATRGLELCELLVDQSGILAFQSRLETIRRLRTETAVLTMT